MSATEHPSGLRQMQARGEIRSAVVIVRTEIPTIVDFRHMLFARSHCEKQFPMRLANHDRRIVSCRALVFGARPGEYALIWQFLVINFSLTNKAKQKLQNIHRIIHFPTQFDPPYLHTSVVTRIIGHPVYRCTHIHEIQERFKKRPLLVQYMQCYFIKGSCRRATIPRTLIWSTTSSTQTRRHCRRCYHRDAFFARAGLDEKLRN